MAHLIILIGLPGSGKSTYAKEYLNDHVENTVWCSSDNIREELYGDASIQGNPDTVFKTLHNRVANYLRKGYTVIYDATNINRKSRKSIIKLGKDLHATIHGVMCWASLQECIDRDKARDRTVGEAVIDKFIRRFEAPYYDEGFDALEVMYNTSIVPWDYMAMLKVAMMIPHDNPHHTLDVWSHCTKAAELMSEETSDNRLVFVMQYHDCGKPYTKFFKDTDVTHAHYYNHNNVGGYAIYGAWAGLESDCIEDLLFSAWAITNHMEPFFNSNYYKTMREDLRSQIDLIHECDKAAH